MSTTGNAEQTSIHAYQLIREVSNSVQEYFPGIFPIGIPDDYNIDLHTPQWGCKGDETKANRLCFLFLADQAGAVTVGLTGAVEGGPEEPICLLDLTFGGTVESGTDVWCEAITLTSYHLAEDAILIADSGNNQPTKFGFDAIGYRYIKTYAYNFVNVTKLNIYARYF
jgi:hypothetical protein